MNQSLEKRKDNESVDFSRQGVKLSPELNATDELEANKTLPHLEID